MRILISAGGTVTAQSLIKALREDGRASFVAIVDLDDLNATKFFVDEFVRVPLAAIRNSSTRVWMRSDGCGSSCSFRSSSSVSFCRSTARATRLPTLGCTLAAPPRDVVLDRRR